MTEKFSVQFANEAFYLAFLGGDFAAMDGLWAHDTDVGCIHPGWEPLLGREQVMESWNAIFANSELPEFEYREVSTTLSSDCAIVLTYEIFEEAFLVATNIFVREDDAWKIIHHQSGGCPPMTDEDEIGAEPLLQ